MPLARAPRRDGGADSLSLQLLTRESAFRLEDAVS
jgi:hypothetical protein